MGKKQWLYGLLVLAGGLAGGALANPLWQGAAAAAAQAPKNIAAQEFTLVDENGKPRASLGNKDGHTAFQIFGRDGHPRAEIDVDPNGAPAIALFDTDHKLRITVAVSSEAIPTVKLYDKNEEPRALIGVDDEGEPGMEFYGTGGKLMRELP